MNRPKTSLASPLAMGFLLHLTLLEGLRAGDPVMPPSAIEIHFQSGLYEASAGAGIVFSPFINKGGRPALNYELTEFQLGYMLTPVRGSSFWRGNVEVAGSVFGGAIVKGRGEYVAGATLWVGYNFLPRESGFFSFFHGGGRPTSTDLDRRLGGENFNFNLNFCGG